MTLESRTTTSSLSIVVITKNQAWSIARLLESIRQHTAAFPDAEVVLVDSASTDETLDIARNYAIRIIRLAADQRLTAAAGRYVGYMHTSAEYVLFLDGDMELCEGWIDKAWKLMQEQPDVGVITGQVLEMPRSSPGNEKPDLDTNRFGNDAQDVLHGGGAALYRRSALEQVGTFHPYVYSDEEPELCIRIRHAGWRVLCLEHPIAYHYSDPAENMGTLIARWRRNLYLGAGQNIRYHLGTEYFWPYLKERGFGLLPGLVLLLGLLSLAWSLISNQWLWFGVWAAALLIAIVGDSFRKRSLYLACASLLKRLLILHGMIKGFFLPPLRPESCPLRFESLEGSAARPHADSPSVMRDMEPPRSGDPCGAEGKSRNK